MREAKEYLLNLKVFLCPEFKKEVSESFFSAGVSASIEIEECYKKEFSVGIDIGYQAGVHIKMGWCQAFAKGFACAAASIINYYLSQY